MRYFVDTEIKDITPEKVEAYLGFKDWKKRKEVEGVASIWSTDSEDREAMILLPLNQQYIDFWYKLEDAIKIIAHVERRSPAKTLNAIRHYNKPVAPEAYPSSNQARFIPQRTLIAKSL